MSTYLCYTRFVMNSDFKLNAQQIKAVEDTEGAILVIAGAGSGKTRVLTARICRLIEAGVSPYNILAITFTNKAANEMKERIERAIGSSDVWTSTFHSMCARMLRQDGDKLGYRRDFTIYTEQESSRLVKRILQEKPSLDQKKYGEFLWHISRAKTLALSPEDYYFEIKNAVSDANDVVEVYTRYEEELRKCNCLDFDDLLLKTVRLFEEYPEVLQRYWRRFKYIHVDEFQDTNVLQYKLVKMLAKGNGNLFVVGDEDQSIYSWRGAEIRNILDFPKDFAGAKVYKLEQNYRSTTSILRVANNVIKHNSNRNEKTLWSEIEDDDSVEFYEAYSDREEASQVARKINQLVKNGGTYASIAVLVRANSLTRQFEEEFNLHGIPYKVFGGFRFFERKEIKDTLAYVRLAINPSDDDSILRVINYPKRGVGASSVQELQQYAKSLNSTLFEALKNPEGLSVSAAKKFAPFTAIAIDLVESVKTMKPDEFMNYVLSVSGIEAALSSSEDEEDESRLENVKELVGAVKQFMKDNEDEELGISDFMQSVALVSDTDDMDGDDYVTIATVHAVKGLEFDSVFIVAAEEGIFPTQRAIISGDIEEERRLMYVAITRARKKLFVLNARSRYRFGKVDYLPKSRFIGEMTGVRQEIRLTNSDYGAGQVAQAARIRLGANDPKSQDFKKRFGLTSSKPAQSDVNYDEFVKDVVVQHSKFGKGVIVMTSGDGEDKIASIAFQGLGVKRFSLAIAAPSLKIIGKIDDDGVC